MRTKRCTKCGEVKPTGQFYRNGTETRRDGSPELSSRCKACKSRLYALAERARGNRRQPGLPYRSQREIQEARRCPCGRPSQPRNRICEACKAQRRRIRLNPWEKACRREASRLKAKRPSRWDLRCRSAASVLKRRNPQPSRSAPRRRLCRTWSEAICRELKKQRHKPSSPWQARVTNAARMMRRRTSHRRLSQQN